VVPNAGHGVMSLACLRDAAARFVSTDDASQALALDMSCADKLPRPPAYMAPAAGRAAP